jgi:hypothetical protein
VVSLRLPQLVALVDIGGITFGVVVPYKI